MHSKTKEVSLLSFHADKSREYSWQPQVQDEKSRFLGQAWGKVRSVQQTHTGYPLGATH